MDNIRFTEAQINIIYSAGKKAEAEAILKSFVMEE